jgi:hypothetical protein
MSKDFPEMEYKPTPEAVELPEGIDALGCCRWNIVGRSRSPMHSDVQQRRVFHSSGQS